MDKTPSATRLPGDTTKTKKPTGYDDSADGRWTVRGVSKDLRTIAVRHAEKQGVAVGDWLSDAIILHAKSAGKTETADLPCLPVLPATQDVGQLVDERLTQRFAEFQQVIDARLTELVRQTLPQPRRWWFWKRKAA